MLLTDERIQALFGLLHIFFFTGIVFQDRIVQTACIVETSQSFIALTRLKNALRRPLRFAAIQVFDFQIGDDRRL